MTRKWAIPLLSIAVLFTGCVVKAPQFDAAKRIAQSVLATDATDDSVDYLWTAKVGDEGRIVKVHQEGQLFVFISEQGDVLAFDGWAIRAVSGFGDDAMRQIVVDGNRRQYIDDGPPDIRECSPWSQRKVEGNTQWVQGCEKQMRPNTILVRADGSIAEISQVVSSSGARALLRPL